jgi:hypothetical protein
MFQLEVNHLRVKGDGAVHVSRLVLDTVNTNASTSMSDSFWSLSEVTI